LFSSILHGVAIVTNPTSPLAIPSIMDTLYNPNNLTGPQVISIAQTIGPPTETLTVRNFPTFGEWLTETKLNVQLSTTALSPLYNDALKNSYNAISRVTNVYFVENPSGPADIYMMGADSIVAKNPDGTLGSTAGVGDFLGPGSPNSFVLFKSTYAYAKEISGAGFLDNLAMHELLHTINLRHTNDKITGLVVPKTLDNNIYSVMSYVTPDGNDESSYGYKSGYTITPMALDIAALQLLYGVKGNAEKNTTYSFVPNGTTIDLNPDDDGRVAVGEAYYSIWDTGGIDVVDFRLSQTRALINLNNATLNPEFNADYWALKGVVEHSSGYTNLPDFVKYQFTNPNVAAGGYLSMAFDEWGHQRGGFTIAATLLDENGNPAIGGQGIENAYGSANDDYIIGNSLHNWLIGFQGDDFIFGGDGDDTLDGGAGNDELRGGNGADLLKGGTGNDIIWVGKDGDFAIGGEGNDTFIADQLFSGSGTATIIGGAGIDRFFLQSSDVELSYSTIFPMQNSFGGFNYYGIEYIYIDYVQPADAFGEWTAGPNGQVFTPQELASAYFTGASAWLNGILGFRMNANFASVAVATIEDTSTERMIFSAALAEIPGIVTGVTGSFSDLYSNDVALQITYREDDNGRYIDAKLPVGYDAGLDAAGFGNVIANMTFDVSYYRIESSGSGTDVTQTTYYENKYLNAQALIINAYDHGLTEIIGPSDVYSGNYGFPAIGFSNDSQEIMHPVTYSLDDDHGGSFIIDAKTGKLKYIKDQTALFPNGADFTLTLRAEDDISSVTKDVTFHLDRTVEEAPTIIDNPWSGEILPVVGASVGQWAVYDINDIARHGGSMPMDTNYTLEQIGSSNPVPLIKPDGILWGFELAREPDPSEIGVPIQVKFTFTDDTGQSASTMINFTISPMENVVEGTAGWDYITADGNSQRHQTINGYAGDDTLIANSNSPFATLRGGEGNDDIRIYSNDSKAFGDEGNDTIEVSDASRVAVHGGTGADQILLSNSASVAVVFDTLSDSIIFNHVSGPLSGSFDTIIGLSDDDTIDLTALGNIEWMGQSTDPTSMLANMQLDANGKVEAFLLDTDRDGTFDFGFAMLDFQPGTSAIHFNGLSDWMLS
jgi:Ca2+-binding RTX toxin-like protein